MYKKLRRLRITVAASYLVLLTIVIADAAIGVTPVGRYVLEVQLVPAILAGSVVWLLLWLLVTISFGRIYCSTVCPLGTLQDAACRLSRMGARGHKRRYRYMPPANMIRIGVGAVVGACLFGGISAVVKATDPFSIFQRIVLAIARPATIGFGALAAAIAAIAVICAIAWYKGRWLCNTVCPAGALLGAVSRQPVYRVDINTDLCIHCGKCEDVCRASCINLTHCTVDASRCVMCLDCTAVCPNSAITVRRGRHTLSTPLMQKAGG